jgi:hypothetical protein
VVARPEREALGSVDHVDVDRPEDRLVRIKSCIWITNVAKLICMLYKV